MKMIISLASYDKRLPLLQKVLETLVCQSIKIDKIVINIPKDHYVNAPEELKNYIVNNQIFELNLITEDLGPHNKYFTVFSKYPNDVIITVDDDYLYNEHMVKDLYDAYSNNPNVIIARKVHHISYDAANKIKPYLEWGMRCTCILNPSYELVAIGGGGILYPPNCFNKVTINIEDIKKCLYGDDIYLKWLAEQNDVKVLFCPSGDDISLSENPIVQETALYKENLLNGRNDEYLKIFPLNKKDETSNDEGHRFSNFIKSVNNINRKKPLSKNKSSHYKKLDDIKKEKYLKHLGKNN